ncbi:eukaryotic translation initiation factor 4B [Teleopsis dalmanni]|uniref:eukaryotic translation initiation factor 4B n=1 Tax=Teleopsis dalmanni TaxID=139649 RepID=UPI0018CD1EB8|nr:eukaryotic translation initiation factor 4B [Teleopsis dalmanni]
MASSGKKGRKNKGTVISLQSFLSNGETPGTTKVTKKIRNPDGEDSDEGNNLPLVYQLPTAPRANRIFDDNNIPHKSPFIAYITNLPFDINDNDIYDFFETERVVSLRLPREEGETGRVRGFGYVEFESREDLIHVLSLTDPVIKGRRIRIDVSNENEQNSKLRSNRRNYNDFGNSSESRDSGNWRKDNGNNSVNSMRDRKGTDENNFASWRNGNRSQDHNLSPKSSSRKMKTWDQNYKNKMPDRFHNEEQESNTNFDVQSNDRPKLNLKPRTLPLPENLNISDIKLDGVEKSLKVQKPAGIAPEKVFGSAKPVDTAKRELEIEERLAEIRRQEKLKRDLDHVNVDEKNLKQTGEKSEKEIPNSTMSWRRKVDEQKIQQGDYDKEREMNRNVKVRDFNDRLETTKMKNNPNKDGKPKEKPKRELKADRQLPKPQSSKPNLVSSPSTNKYSGLEDEASE